MKHNKKQTAQPMTNVLDIFYRSVVNNSGSKTLAMKELLENFSFVCIEVLEKKADSVTIRISEVKQK